MKVLFWNLGGPQRAERALECVAGLLDAHEPDVVTFTEAPTNTEARARGLGLSPVNLPGTRLERGLMTFRRGEVLILHERSVDRHYQAFEARRADRAPLNVVTVHLRSPLHDENDSRERKRAQRLREFVERFEEDSGHDRTLVYGDFNMDPFSRGMIDIDGLNAVSTRYRSGRARTSEGTTTATFYNPMWSLLGDRPLPAGSLFVRDDGPTGYFWHMPDQLLLRGTLRESLVHLQVLDAAGANTLVTARAGTPHVSDHLPLFFALEEDMIWKEVDDAE